MDDDQNKRELLSCFTQVFKFKRRTDKDEIAPEDYVGFCDESNTFMVVPKLKSLKKHLQLHFTLAKDGKGEPIPNINYDAVKFEGTKDKLHVMGTLKGGEIKDIELRCKYSVVFIGLVAKMCLYTKTKAGSVVVKMKPDYPLWVESDELILIVAPRIENE